MKKTDWIGFLIVIIFVIISKCVNNIFFCLLLFLCGAIPLLLNGSIIVEDEKYRVYLPHVQCIIGLFAILYGSIDAIHMCGFVYSILMSVGGFVVIVGLKNKRIAVHRVITSPLALIILFFCFKLAFSVNSMSAAVSGIIAVLVALFGIVFSDRNWLNHFMMKK